MARSGIRYEDVQSAAESLLGRGLNPTIQRIREVLGTGSNTTISEHLKSWQQHMADTPKAILPPSIPEAVTTALNIFWKTAVQHAEDIFAEQRQLAAQSVAEAEKSRDQAINAQQAAQADTARHIEQLDIERKAVRKLTDQLLVEQERRTTAESAIQAAEQRVVIAQDNITQIRHETTARVTQLEAMVQTVQTEMDRCIHEAKQQLDQERQRSETNESHLMQLIDQIRLELANERHHISKERENWNQREIQWQAQRELQQHELAERKIAEATLQERYQGLCTELERLNMESEQLRTEMESMAQEHWTALRKIEMLTAELRMTTEIKNRLQEQIDNINENHDSAISVK
ncbi:MAG: hypothetical protein CSA09_04640 [Candidatus Contendobacter odensis]|uniref:KfrA N-terminal DNA-binding domain-containing protein n=1 Tax=Candidatus Contendibacter odensensis TaxID=1400860 RepID=A0A2G6PE56_9GAMM|nr:MAG: hypothetical protein CSA09_04640 [Candidatus Contendobacter odensis]